MRRIITVLLIGQALLICSAMNATATSEETINLPGLKAEDVEITVHQDTLTIGVKEQAERETQEGERVYRELRRSNGTRTLTLPSGMDTENASATFDNGMLRLSIPRAEAAKPRHIAVTQVTEAPVAVAAESQVAEDETGSDTADQA